MRASLILFLSLTVLASCTKKTGKEDEVDLAAEKGEIVIDGGGQTYGNKVFIDLSDNKQTAVQRTAWDLGFYTGDEFRVILNSSTGMMAKATDKTDLNDVSAADTAGLSEQMSFSAFSTEALPYIDYPDGDLAKTAIAAVSASADENKVYIINRGTGVGSPAPDRGWKKIRVTRNSSGGYTLQHADIASTEFTEVQVAKPSTHFFDYVSFESGAATVEPEKDKWDLAWTYFSNVTSFGGGEIPYAFQDFVLQNDNVESAMVKDSVIAYESFVEANLSGLTFATHQNSIGSDWRAGGGPNSAPAIRTDRYYVIRDANGNYYKIKFTSLTRDGERGYPSLKYDLVRKAD